MREIKFRAWDGQQMRDTFSVQSNGDGVLYSGEIVDWVAMQFTGLKEHDNEDPKDNKEIYDGDIIEFSDGSRLSVEWNDDTCQWQYSDGSPINDGDRYGSFRKIVGNIYEHPHLAKVKK